MSLVRVFSPQSASERMVVVAMLEAHGIPTLDHNGHLASVLPGVQINAYNTSSVMVPEEHRALALALLEGFRRQDAPPSRAQRSPLGWRNLAEWLLMGWFVPRATETPADAPPLAKFVAFHAVPESAAFEGQKVSFAVTIAHSPEGVVLVFNRWRRVWELPGGLVDAGESPRDCAPRELREEAGCEARRLAWLGIVEVEDQRRHLGAVFRCDVDEIPEKEPDEEILGLACWTPDRAPPGLGPTDEELLERFGVR